MRNTLVAVIILMGGTALRAVDLPVEPIRNEPDPTLAQAALRNDYPAFVTLYQSTADPRYAELHAFWTWSMTDHVGGFYGSERHRQLASLYPDYNAFINAYRIIDANGRVFYPSSETRTFLLEKARRAGVPPVGGRLARRPALVPVPVAAPLPGSRAGRPAAAGETPAFHEPAPVRDSRGVFLFIVAMLGVGMITLMIQTPGNHHAPAP